MTVLWGAGQGYDVNVLRGGGNKNWTWDLHIQFSSAGERGLGGGTRTGHISISCSGERLADTPLLCWEGSNAEVNQISCYQFLFVSSLLLFLWLTDVMAVRELCCSPSAAAVASANHPFFLLLRGAWEWSWKHRSFMSRRVSECCWNTWNNTWLAWKEL